MGGEISQQILNLCTKNASKIKTEKTATILKAIL
jgi:hypothetical protein